MFYLAKFCRICVQSGIKLVNLETLDSDSIALSEKLKTCTNMVITRESLSKAICMQCVKKLRICYDFQHMCKQSDKILEGYLTELLSSSDKVTAFDNTELSVTVTPLSLNSNHWKRKRITKEERCSLLKKLLSAGGKIKRHNKFYRSHIIAAKSPDHESKGGLRDIINFTSNYDFGYSIDKNHNVEATPLEKLTAFSNNFFTSELTNFNKTLLDIIDTHNNETYDSDEDDMFDKLQAIEDEEPFVKIEEVVIEPDIKIKNEVEYEDENEDYAANFVETSYFDSKDIKKENIEMFPSDEPQDLSNSNCLDFNVSVVAPQSSSVNMLGNFVETFSACKTFSKHSIRCRTRNSPYINPQLKEQFQKRCFKCTKCSRYFKSPGYLKAHLSKVHR